MQITWIYTNNFGYKIIILKLLTRQFNYFFKPGPHYILIKTDKFINILHK